MDNQHCVIKFSTYHKAFLFLLLLALIISCTVVLKHYCRGQVIVSLFRLKKCVYEESYNSKIVNIVSIIRGDKKAHLKLLNIEPVGYKDMELMQTYFYRGQRKDIPLFGDIPNNVKQKLQPIHGALLKQNTKTEFDYVVWVFKVTGSKPKGPTDNICEFRWLCINIKNVASKINK
ncbi:hypothetical protein IMX26_01055 [Clostridium sp. 'deep sea']|uniref:hypothetical protein n=1 Tax=Clostridium sp. 'deep sea' TaxID=2779445 RepID=UPI00189649F7|nr:hypothetical protein [Clostridium sp. 'deep sea']QOR35465.1 hypothetical protein IMX26_01055 [Clostridium sp. 'deep sea']